MTKFEVRAYRKHKGLPEHKADLKRLRKLTNFWSRDQSLTPHSTKLASTGWKVMSLTRPDIRPLSSEGTGTSNWAQEELSDSQN